MMLIIVIKNCVTINLVELISSSIVHNNRNRTWNKNLYDKENIATLIDLDSYPFIHSFVWDTSIHLVFLLLKIFHYNFYFNNTNHDDDDNNHYNFVIKFDF